MHIRNKPPQFVPVAYRDNIEKLSKAFLMDLAWDLAQQLAEGVGDENTAHRFWEGVSVIKAYRDK